jgi:hypothetical protein
LGPSGPFFIHVCHSESIAKSVGAPPNLALAMLSCMSIKMRPCGMAITFIADAYKSRRVSKTPGSGLDQHIPLKGVSFRSTATVRLEHCFSGRRC